jgi:hypothetical protein
MPALVAGIHVFEPAKRKVVDARHKAGHDGGEAMLSTNESPAPFG